MKIIADENLFQPIIDYLKSLSHDVLSIRETNLSGISDDEIYKIACRENRIIITMDKDFLRTLRYSPEKCGGIIVVKIYKRSVKDTTLIFKNYFSAIKEEEIFKNTLIITPDGVRIRKSEI